MARRKTEQDRYTKNIGIVLRALRENHNWSQDAVAFSLGELLGKDICQSTIQRIEAGQYIITVQRLVMLAKVFDACPHKILAAVTDYAEQGKQIDLAAAELTGLQNHDGFAA